MIKGYFRCLSCLWKKPLLEDQYGTLQEGQYNPHQINNLTNLVEQSRVISQEKEEELHYKLTNVAPVTIVENITKCKRVSNCQHDTCDFGPMVKTIRQVRSECKDYADQYSAILDEHLPKIKKRDEHIQKLKYTLNDRNKEIEEKDQVISDLNEQIQVNINNLTNHINWYKVNYQRLLDENEFIKNDNAFLLRSQNFHKDQSTKLRTRLASVPEDEEHVLGDTESTFPQQFGTYSQ